ncbi:putative ubiquitin carboxyl-terminal hydrolase FAF-X-like protein [Dinothrombium tinctorium]|uniref:ubiquitinyl hydrolase 1 n=1 Tax=Dinothrombium tinctorium TaxID=1965070 RepID=A0A3S3P387_9ACAR|nr:putative ubiquitin carboxyl-terminal hydrolase FAF-X-like protein [Dinothrombium tinctorium]
MTVAIRGGSGGGAPNQQVNPPANDNQNRSDAANIVDVSIISNEESITTTDSVAVSYSPNSANEPSETNECDPPVENLEDVEPEFPITELARLDDMINRPRWVIPVLPRGELEILLDAAIDLCRRGLDTRSEACQRFFREGLTISFTKILTDEAVSGWKFEIHRCIMQNCERLIELIVLKLNQDWFPLLDLLAMVFNPSNKFHVFTSNRPETIPPNRTPEEEFARSTDPRAPRGWLIELINKFGKLDGFKILLERFEKGPPLSVPLIAALIRPFGYCYELLTVSTIEKYFLPIIQMVPAFLENLTDEELKKDSKNETKNDALSGIVKALKNLASRIPNQEETIKNLEIFRLRMILRLLQISSFNGKMNALNEVNKVITSVSYYSHRHSGGNSIGVEEEEWLTAERMAQWIMENKVLQIVLRDSLHQPQYVEKLEKIIRFVIKEKALTLEDLDDLWAAQCGKHEAIVKNVHDLLAKLAWDFTPEQLDHLFDCFQASWTNATKKQREKLLELIRRLAEDDKDGVMAHKVLNLLWNLAHNDDIPTDIMDQALAAHVKILDYSCCQDRDSQKTEWLDKCVEELNKPDGGNWVLPALKQIREICCLYNEAPPNFTANAIPQGNAAHQRSTHMMYRHEVITRLQNQQSLVIKVSDNISLYMNKARQIAKDNPNLNPNFIYPGKRFSHTQEVQERLNFLRFLLKDGQLWLCAPQAKQIWKCLAENEVYPEDREACFRWFSQLMTEEPDLDPEINKDFFENNILQLEPSLVTESGIECFDKFFKAVNVKEGKLVPKRRSYCTEDLELIGLDYLWRVVLSCSEEVANSGIELLKEIYTNLGPRLQANQLDIHEDFVQTCMDRLKASFDTVSVLEEDDTRIRTEVTKMTRVLKALFEYIYQCDTDFGEERTILPMGRSFRGRNMTLTIRFPNQGRNVDDVEVHTHTNEPLSAVRRQILTKVKANNMNMRVDLFINNELIDPDMGRDKKLVMDLPLKDKMILSGKLYQVNTNMPSSPDSSSDSSIGSPHHPYDGPNVEAENMLPGVIMAQQHNYAQFFFQLADLGMSLNSVALRDCALDILKIMPADKVAVETLKTLCQTCAESSEDHNAKFDAIFYTQSPTQAAYYLGCIYSLLMPARNPLSEEAQEFQYNFMKSGCGFKVLELLNRNNFLSRADDFTKICSYLMVLKISKLVLATLAHYIVLTGTSSSKEIVVLQQALHSIPNPSADSVVREVAQKTAQLLKNHEKQPLKLTKVLPEINSIKAVMILAWVTATGRETALQASIEKLHSLIAETHQSPIVVYMTYKEALEVLTIMLMLSPLVLEQLMKDETWQTFIIDLLLVSSNRSVRQTALEEFVLIATKCPTNSEVLVKFINLLHSHLRNTVPQNSFYKTSQEFFRLFCKLLNNAFITRCSLPQAQQLLEYEIDILRHVRQNLVKNGLIEEIQLEGHLGITKELIALLNSQQKYEVGCDSDNWHGNKNRKGMIKILIDEYIFPASRAMVLQQKSNISSAHIEEVNPICNSSATLTAGFDVLVALCTGCIPNLKYVADTLIEMFYSDNEQPLTEWEYLPPIGPRPTRGFVGLKNAGATCYMNSVLQQLYMIPEIRDGILMVEGAATDLNEDFSGEDKIENNIVSVGCDINQSVCDDERGSREETRREYNLGVLKYVQAIFGHLALSKLQYYVPRGFWKHFKLWGEPVNLREQHDALEFFNSLVDSLDEALKSLNYSPIMSRVLGGSFADQKICKDCPHRFSREESFTTLNIDIRNHSNLLDSLEQYVKGDLLEGANAYHCEKCNRKVDTVKRLCIKKLPIVLAIQLKRFDYDWERECAIKFNDYFEFPRVLDMEPYTVRGLAKLEGELIDDDLVACDDDAFNETQTCTKYDLCGIVVHSGQASGGHYYSYILYKHIDGTRKWYKFDDGDVTECKLDDDEEMRIQCFGGEYMGEVFDHMLKRMSCRRQKRWWNAYILVYRRVDTQESQLSMRLNELTLMESKVSDAQIIKMPLAIQRSVQKQNIKFMHTRNQFSVEYFEFMKKILRSNGQIVFAHCQHEGQEAYLETKKDIEELAMICTHLAARFLFNTCFHTKKTLRGQALDWFEVLNFHLRASPTVRAWFAHYVLFAHMFRFCEYLLDCPSTDVRSAFGKIIVFLAHYALKDGNCQVPIHCYGSSAPVDAGIGLSDQLIQCVLSLLKKDVSEHSRHLSQYFNLFFQYASLGTAERAQLLRLNVAATFILVALDEGPGPPIKYQYADLGKLYQVVSLLVRCCDVSSKCASSHPGSLPLPNPYGVEEDHRYIMPIQPAVVEHLYNKPTYVKKIIEDANNTEDTIKLLKFCCWENPHFSSVILNELLWQIAYSYSYELRPHFDTLYHMLLIEDSWQEHRIHNALKGMQDDREGLFDTIHRNKTHYQKRAYQCIKCLVTLFSTCNLAAQILQSNNDLKRKWTSAVAWLNDELERRPYTSTTQYGYNWSPPAQSNETSNGYYLERSHSAKITLAKAIELCPEDEREDQEEQEMSEDTDSPPPEADVQDPFVTSFRSVNKGPPPFNDAQMAGDTCLTSETQGTPASNLPRPSSDSYNSSSRRYSMLFQTLDRPPRLRSTFDKNIIMHRNRHGNESIQNVQKAGDKEEESKAVESTELSNVEI